MSDETSPLLTRIDTPANVHISFTGGKDSMLVFHLIKLTMPHITIKKLVTFYPITDLAHPNAFIKVQAEALGFPSEVLIISNVPSYLECYRAYMKRFYDDDQVAALATGDIEDVGHGFMGKAAHPTGLRIFSPLFGIRRGTLLSQFQEYKLKPLITLISLVHVPLEVAFQVIGRFLDSETIQIIQAHNARVACGIVKEADVCGKPNKHHLEVDLCGENGEFHTMCLDGSLYLKRVGLVDLASGKETQGCKVPTKITDDGYGQYLHLDYNSGGGIGFELYDKGH
ncbi:UNVERIFIED_CONTAM: hypothetical protein HDU68_011606 [Siphonaria sp. JEL0065]|nr:hypothetical protein HDU68_011606 [Siphonaria sp. JEL0065]